MKKIALLLLIVGLHTNIFAQADLLPFANPAPKQIIPARGITDQALSGIRVDYRFYAASVIQKNAQNTDFQLFRIPEFGLLNDIGKAALPVHYDLIALPENADYDLSFSTDSSITHNSFYVYPAQELPKDTEGAPNPPFKIDNGFYNRNTFYPASPVIVKEIIRYRGVHIALIQVCPIQFNPVTRQIITHKNLSYELEFNQAQRFINRSDYTDYALGLITRKVLNGASITSSSVIEPKNRGVQGPAKDYIIITHDNYLAAADSLAKWKRQLGYRVEIVSHNNWTDQMVDDSIYQRYQNWSPKPGYFVIIGDQADVPGKILPTSDSIPEYFASDLYYASMDSANDYFPDMAHGRISVSSASQAMSVVQKIINYEKQPPSSASFYSKGLNCAQFQDDDVDGYADRRFSQTSEEVLDYMVNQQSFNVERVYSTDPTVNPTNWNNGDYSAGESIPSAILKPGFGWAGDASAIKNSINNNVLYVLHRDHGYVGGSGWAHPEFTTSSAHVGALSNGDYLPVVFSMNCHTGEFQLNECFAEKFLRHDQGGAVGVIAAAYYSYSGFNDALTLGMFDAIWSNPGLTPNFTGYYGNPNPSIPPHDDILTMGDVLDHGLMVMAESWYTSIYTNEIFHYFGDPAMRIWNKVPGTITANHAKAICFGDTILNISGCNVADATVTMLIGTELIDKTTLSAGNGQLKINAFFAADTAIITISKANYKPYIAYVPIQICGGPPSAGFTYSATSICTGDSILFVDTSTNYPTSRTWTFTGGIPASSKQSPVWVKYNNPGSFDVKLKVANSLGTDSLERKSLITVDARPVADFTINNPTQPLTGNNFVFTNTSTGTGNLSYKWYFGDGFTSIVQNASHAYLAGGSYNVSLVASSPAGCSDSVTKKVVVIDTSKKIKADFIINSPKQCHHGNSFTFTDNSNSAYHIKNYDWDIDSNGVFSDANGNPVYHTFSSPGKYRVGLRVINDIDDTGWVYKSVEIYPSPNIKLHATEACEGDSSYFTDSTDILYGSIVSRMWDFDSDGAWEDTGKVFTSTLYNGCGAYRVTLRVESNKGCVALLSQQVNVNYKPSVDFMVKNACLGDSTKFFDQTFIGGDSLVQWKWFFDDGDSALIRNPLHLYQNTGSYDVGLQVWTNKACYDSVMKSIVINPPPVFNLTFIPDSVISQGDSALVSVNGAAIDSVFWSTGKQGKNTHIAQQGTYGVRVIDINGCDAVDSFFIRISSSVNLNFNGILTPNADGINDRFVISNLNLFSPCSVKIFNRWGEEIYSSSNYNNTWDGTRNGKTLPDGTYYFIMRDKNGILYTGTVNILN